MGTQSDRAGVDRAAADKVQGATGRHAHFFPQIEFFGKSSKVKRLPVGPKHHAAVKRGVGTAVRKHVLIFVGSHHVVVVLGRIKNAVFEIRFA